MGESGDARSGSYSLIGIFAIVFGLCLFLAGGACTIMWLVNVVGSMGEFFGHGFGPLLLWVLAVALTILLAGLLCIREGSRELRTKKTPR